MKTGDDTIADRAATVETARVAFEELNDAVKKLEGTVADRDDAIDEDDETARNRRETVWNDRRIV